MSDYDYIYWEAERAEEEFRDMIEEIIHDHR